MTQGFIITATDTNVGKTIFAAALTSALQGVYWKPVQSGRAGGTDREIVDKLIMESGAETLPESYIFSQPLSPHRAAEIDEVKIDFEKLQLPQTSSPLIVEGAGGLMVPLSRDRLQVEQFREWDLPVILCARTQLGTINHTLLSVAALREQGIPLHGIVFVGHEMLDTQNTIAGFSGAKILGRMPVIETLSPQSVQAAFTTHFNVRDFA